MKPWVKYVSALLIVLVLCGLGYGYVKFAPLANTGTGLVAHQMCSCVHVSNRPLDACLDDRWPNVETISAKQIEVDGVPGIEASSFITSRTATYEEGFGCTLQD